MTEGDGEGSGGTGSGRTGSGGAARRGVAGRAAAPRGDDTGPHAITGGAGFALGAAVVALVVAVVATRILIAHPLARSGAAAVWLSSVCVWVPLVAAVVVVGAVRRRSAAAARAPLFAPADLVWGIGAGLLARALDAALSTAVTGSTGLSPAPTLGGGGGPAGALAVALVLAPVVVAPVVEEVFFRGLAQEALGRILAGPAPRPVDRLSAWTAAAIVAVVFAIVHVLVAPSDPVLLTVGGTLLLGTAAGGIAAQTGRLGGTVVAHVIFNGVAVVATWPG